MGCPSGRFSFPLKNPRTNFAGQPSIGAGFGSSPVGELFTGNIYLSKVYNRVLTSTEISQVYNYFQPTYRP